MLQLWSLPFYYWWVWQGLRCHHNGSQWRCTCFLLKIYTRIVLSGPCMPCLYSLHWRFGSWPHLSSFLGDGEDDNASSKIFWCTTSSRVYLGVFISRRHCRCSYISLVESNERGVGWMGWRFSISCFMWPLAVLELGIKFIFTMSFVRPGHVVRWLFWMHLTKMYLTGVNNAACKKFIRSALLPFFLMMTDMVGEKP